MADSGRLKPNTKYHIPNTEAKPLVVIVGETASGKSALALEIASKFNGEIISADSWAVRQQLNIGTAKPSKEELELVPHHLLNVVEPCANFTAVVYKRLALAAIKDINNRGKLPIIAGGSGLYIDGVIFDFSFLNGGTPQLRDYLNNLTIVRLLRLTQERGFDLTGIDTRNKRRLIRLLETGGQRPTRQSLRANTLVLGLKIDRETLKQRIAKRVDSMIQKGLEKEVKQLSEAYGWECEGLKGIGYTEWRDYFEGKQNLQETQAKIIKSTNDLAKRQRTYFKRNPFIQWVDNKAETVEILAEFLNKKT